MKTSWYILSRNIRREIFNMDTIKFSHGRYWLYTVFCLPSYSPFLKTGLWGGGCMHTGQRRTMGVFCPSLPVSLRQGLFLSLRLLFFYARLETGKYLTSLYLCPDRSWYYRQVLGVQLAMWVLEFELESSWFLKHVIFTNGISFQSLYFPF